MSDDCGCCTDSTPGVPALVANRPGLTAVAYRIGTFAGFRRAILDRLARTPELTGLTARTADDHAVTAIELWAAVADVLTFYQERIANEAFLRTATLRDSVLRLARLIGYELSPGAAATTMLAFTLEAGKSARIPARTRVKSVPREGAKAQTFETLAGLAADSRLNVQRILPLPSDASPTGAGAVEAIVAPDPEALSEAATLTPGDGVMLYSPNAVEVLRVESLVAQDDRLTLRWRAPIAGSAFAGAAEAGTGDTRAYRLGRSFGLFGADTAPSMLVAVQTTTSGQTTSHLVSAATDYTLPAASASSAPTLSLDGRYEDLAPGSIVLVVRASGDWTVAVPFRVTATRLERVTQEASNTTPPVTTTARSESVTTLSLTSLSGAALGGGDVRDIVVHELLGAPLRFWPHRHAPVLASREVVLPGRRAGWSSIEVGRTLKKGVAQPGVVLDLADVEIGRALILTDQAGGAAVSARVESASLLGSQVTLSAAADDPGTIARLGLAAPLAAPVTVVVSRRHDGHTSAGVRGELSVTIGSVPTQTVTIEVAAGTLTQVAEALQATIRAALPGAPGFARARAWNVRDAIAVAPGIPGERIAFGPSASDPATVAALGLDAAGARVIDGVLSGPIALASPVSGAIVTQVGLAAPSRLTLSSVAKAEDLALQLAQSGPIATLVVEDRVLVLPVPPTREPRAFLRLTLQPDAPIELDAASAVLHGNVAHASHGESVRAEILGDGDASQEFARLALAKRPLTYLPAPVAGGVRSSLELLVNGELWEGRPALYGASPDERAYITRAADDQTVTLQFGDGTTGRRLPTGRQNILARYRHGIGLAGRVPARALTSLLDRPTGVRGVVNPLAADGGVDPETLERARQAAPGTVRTFGRAVSLRDFEDAALVAGELAKASASWVWTGERRVIHLTIAAQGGALFSPDGLRRIGAALAAQRDPNQRLMIANYAPVAVVVEGAIVVDERRVAAEVLVAARAALLAALSFEVRRFAQPVHLSDVYAVLQDVQGVVAVDIDRLDLKSADVGFRRARGVDDTLPRSAPHPRLLMLPARPAGAPGAVLPAELARVEDPAGDVRLDARGGLS